MPIYPTYPPDLIAYVVNDAQAKTLIVEDATQLAKALEARPKMDSLREIVVMSGYEPRESSDGVMSWDALRRLGLTVIRITSEQLATGATTVARTLRGALSPA